MIDTLPQEELLKCAKCGKCRSVCPVFKATINELMVSRGRLFLLQKFFQNKKPPEKELSKILDTCILCLKCASECPSGVNIEMILPQARKLLKNPFMNKLQIGMLKLVLPYRKLYNLFVKVFSFLQDFFSLPKKDFKHIPLIFASPPYLLPPIASCFALNKIQKNKSKIFIFTGCLANFVYPDIIHNICEVLSKFNISFNLDPSQLCCGLPSLLYGYENIASILVKKNLRIINPSHCKFILTPCASCSRMLKEKYPLLADNEELKELMEEKVKDPFAFIYTHLPLSLPKLQLNVTYHNPCHNTYLDLKDLIKNTLIRTANFMPLETENDCCGGGGIYTFKYPTLAHKIVYKKMQELKNKNIHTLVTPCPGCIMQLKKQTILYDLNVEILHPIQYLLKVLKG